MKTNKKTVIFGMLLVGLMVVATAAQAAIYFDDDLESGLNTSDSNADNYWYPQPVRDPPNLTTDVSHSSTHSVEAGAADKGYKADVSWLAVQRSYEAWIMSEDDSANQYFSVWSDIPSSAFAPGPTITLAPDGDIDYFATKDDTPIDTGLDWAADTWYHVGIEVRPGGTTNNKCDFWISTSEGLFNPATDLIASNVNYSPTSSTGHTGALYFAKVYADDVEVYDGSMNLIPEPATMIVLMLGGLGIIVGRCGKKG